MEIGVTGFHKTRDEAHLLGVKSTLRALIACGSRSLTPLLLDLADQLQIPLEFYSFPPKPAIPRPNLVASVTVSKDWSIRARPEMQKFSLRNWLICPAYFVEKTHKFVSRNDVLRQISESEGGAHFDLSIKEIIDGLHRSTGSNYSGIHFFLIYVSALVFWSGKKLLLVNECRNSGVDANTDPRTHELDDFFDKLKISMM